MHPIVTKLATAGATAAAAVVARRAVEYGWSAVTGEDPPSGEDVDSDKQLRDLLIWSAVLSAAVMVARKIAVSTTERYLGSGEDE